MYKSRFISFWYVLVMILLLQIARVMSRKLTEEEGVTDSMSHLNIPRLLMSSLNAVQAVVRFPVQMQKTSSMKHL